MRIDITKEHYQIIAKAMQVAGTVYGVLGDMVDKKYKVFSHKIDEAEDVLFSYAKEFDFEDNVEVFDDKNVASEDYLSVAQDDLEDYDKYVFWEELVTQFVKQEFADIYNRDARRSMTQEDMRHKLWELEDKYWKEIEARGTNCLKFCGE